MRNALSAVCMLLAGLLACTSLAGFQINQLLRDEEPIRHLIGDLPAQEEFSQAISEVLLTEVEQRIPDEASWLLGGPVEDAIGSTLSGLLDNERVSQAWDDSLQNTRRDYVDRLERIFHEGTTGDPQELSLHLDLSPVTAALTEPLRQAGEDYLGWLIDEETFDVLAPEIVVDIDNAAVEDGADPYTWATLAVVSQYWVVVAVLGGVFLLFGLLLGRRRGRWICLGAGSLAAAGIGLWITLTVASPDFEIPPGTSTAAVAVLEHIEQRFTEWAQPAWWVLTGIAGFLGLAAVVLGAVLPSRRREADFGYGAAGAVGARPYPGPDQGQGLHQGQYQGQGQYQNQMQYSQPTQPMPPGPYGPVEQAPVEQAPVEQGPHQGQGPSQHRPPLAPTQPMPHHGVTGSGSPGAGTSPDDQHRF